MTCKDGIHAIKIDYVKPLTSVTENVRRKYSLSENILHKAFNMKIAKLDVHKSNKKCCNNYCYHFYSWADGKAWPTGSESLHLPGRLVWHPGNSHQVWLSRFPVQRSGGDEVKGKDETSRAVSLEGGTLLSGTFINGGT